MKRTITILCFVMLFVFAGQAQQLDMDLMKGITVRSIGPAGMSGRVTAIDAVHEQPEIIYAGTASGGLWKSENGGIHWVPVFDSVKTLSVGAVAIDQSNPDVVWVGTGEGNPRNSLNGGFGVYRTLNGGRTWQLMGLEQTRNIHRIIVHPNDPNTVYVGAIGSPWGEHPERGVFKTTDGGKTWNKVLYINEKTGVADMVMDPSNPNKLFVGMWEHLRKPWTFTSGGPGSGLYMTEDGFESYKKLSPDDGLPKGDLGRIGLAISRSNPKRIYALIESKKNALYRSDDGGYSWRMINDKSEIGNRPFYYSEIYVDPENDNRLYSLFSYVNVSEDGGRSFEQLMDAYGTSRGVHPDHHAWWIHPENPDYMIEGNDGGLNITYDRGKTWRFVENLPLAQFYHISVDNEYPYNVYGGMQDNGSWGGPAYVWKSQGIRNSYWQELAFGDGFDVVPDPDDARYGYAMSQEGFVVRYDRETGHNRIVRPTHPVADTILRFNWNSAIAQDPFDNGTIYFGSQFVHKSTNKGHTWEIISPDLTTNDPEKQKQHLSGGLTMDATGAENNTTIVAIEPSPLKKDLIWAGSDDGLVHLTRDGGENWSRVSIPGMPAASWVNQIRASSHREGEAFVVVNNYRNFDFKPYLFHTTDYGKTWESLVSQDQVWSYALSFVQDLVEPNLMFLGTDGGLYVSVNGGRQWTHWTKDYPNVSTMDLAIHPREHDLVIGTFGRAAYVMDDIRPLRKIAAEGTSLMDRSLVLFEPPVAYQTLNQQPSGTRFGADAIFNGENRPSGAMITYYLKVPEKKKEEPAKEEKKKKKKESKDSGEAVAADSTVTDSPMDSVVLEIFRENGEQIRTLKWKAPEEGGIKRTYWYMNEKGADRPSRNEPRGNRGEPGGVTVMPGTYKLRMTWGEHTDSSMVEVKFDPRVNMPSQVLQAQYEMSKRLEDDQALAAEAMKRLRHSLAVADDYSKRMSDLDKEKFKEEIKLAKATKDSISDIMDFIVGQESDQQGIVSFLEVPVTSRLGTAGYYIGSSLQAPGPTEERLVQQAEEALQEALKMVNEFYETEWPAFREKVSGLDLLKFKDYEPLEMD